MKKNLILIQSPLQALCALHAIKYFDLKIEETDFLIVYHSEKQKKTNYGCERILESHHISYKYYKIKNNLDAIRNLFCSYSMYELAIIGDIYNTNLNFYATGYLKRNGKIIYVDDGNSSVIYIQKLNNPKKNTWKYKIFSHINSIAIKLKAISVDYFTVFSQNGYRKGFNIIHNPFFEKSLCAGMVNKLVVVGAISELYIGDYIIELKKLSAYISNKFQESQVLYFPHRRENKLDEIREMCKDYKWELVIPEINIEIELSKWEEAPLAVVGFTSSCLLTLRYMFPASKIINVQNPKYKGQAGINSFYEKQGITNIVL